MGYAKDKFIERQENPYRNYSLKKRVCVECFYPSSIKEYIKSNSDSVGCDYCNSDSEHLSYDAAKVIEYIYRSLLKIYSDDGRDYFYRDGEIHDYIYRTYEIEELIYMYSITSDEGNLREDIINLAEIGSIWYKTRELNRENDTLLYHWYEFQNALKHKYRFMNFNIDSDSSLDFDQSTRDQFLDNFLQLIKERKLVTVMTPGEMVYRARWFSDKEPFDLKIEEMCGPPPEKSISSRMSPAGISVLYGSEDLTTACNEINLSPPETVAFCTFRVEKDIKVINFSRDITLPRLVDECLFDETISADDIYMSEFLNDFIQDLSRPIKKDGKEHFEYAPTQFLSEFLKVKLDVRGIIWSSSVNEGKKSYCLFLDREECGIKAEIGEPKEQILKMNSEIKVCEAQRGKN